MAESATTPTAVPTSRRRYWRWALIVGAILVVLTLGAVGGLRLYFNDAYIKAEIITALKTALGRDVEIRTLQASLLSGSVRIEGLRVENPEPGYVEGETVRIESVDASVSLIPLLFSGGRSLRNLNIAIERPVLIVERRGVWPMDELSIDDLLKKFSEGPPGTWPKQTGLRNLNAQVTVNNGLCRFIDRSTNLGDSELQNIALNLAIPALNEPVSSRVTFDLQTANSKQPGNASLESAATIFGADGSIDPAAFKNVAQKLVFKNLDLPHLARYVRVQGKLSDGKFVWSMGKPVSGELSIAAPTMDAIKLTTTQDTDGLISIWEKGRWLAGNLPSRLECELQASLTARKLSFGPLQLHALIAPTRAQLTDAKAPRLLDTSITATPAADGSLGFKVRFNARMDELFATDVGTVLELKERIGGEMDGSVDATFASSEHIKLDGVFKTVGGYVAARGVRQPTSFEVKFGSVVKPNADGTPEHAELMFHAKSGSFEIGSRQPVVVTSLNNPQALGAQARLEVHLRGREFWKEYGPLLQVANLSTPLEEALDGEIVVTGKPGELGLQLDCTLGQQKENPTPLRLSGQATYDGTALVDEPTKPYLSFDLRLNSAADKSIDIRLAGNAVRGKKEQVIALPTFAAMGDLSSLNQLNQRFGAYVSVLLGPQYKAAGYIKQSGQSKLTQTLLDDGAVGAQTLTLETEVTLAQFSLNGPPLLPGKPPVTWTEAEPATLKLSFNAQSVTGGATTLSIPVLALDSKLLTLHGKLQECDQGKLHAAAVAKKNPLRLWMEALPQASIDTRVSAEALQRLQQIGVFENEPLAIGDLILKAEYDPKTRLAKVPALRFRGAELEFNTSVAEVPVPGLVALAESKERKPAQMLAALPSMALEAVVRPAVIARLQAEQILPADPALRGTLTLKGLLDRAKSSLDFDFIKFNGAAADVTLEGTRIAVATLVRAETPGGAVAALQQGNIAAVARPELFGALRNLKLLPETPALAGTLTLSASVPSPEALTVEKLSFERAGNNPLLSLSASSDISHVSALIDTPPTQLSTLLPHFKKGLNLKDLSVDTVALCQVLKQMGRTDGWINDVLGGHYIPTAPWRLSDVVVKAGAQPETLEVAATASAPVRIMRGSAAVASLLGDIRTPALKINLKDGKQHIEGALNMDAAQLSCSAAHPYYAYYKPIGMGTSLTFNVTQDADGTIHAPQLALQGGPLNAEVSNLVFKQNAKGMLALVQKLVLSDGPLPGTILNFKLDTAADQLGAQVALGNLDLARVASFATLPAGLTVSGRLANTTVSYDGRLSALSSTFNLNDKLALQCALQDVKVTAQQAGETATLSIAGPLLADTTRIHSDGFAVNLIYTGPNSLRAHHILALPLDVLPKGQNDLLLNALRQPGLPVLVRAPVKAQSVIDINTLLRSVNVLSATASPGPSSGSGLEGVRHLRVESALTTPQLYTGGPVLGEVTIPALTFDELLVTIPKADANLFGGQVSLTEANYNLARTPLTHSQLLRITNLDLQQATADPTKKPDKDTYQIFGKVNGGGRLSGSGFSQAERRSWAGNLQLNIAALVAQRGDGKAAPFTSAEGLKKFGLGLGGMVLGGSELTAQLGRALLIYSDDFGLFLNKLEFAPLTIDVGVQKGLATINRGSLIGLNRATGLQMDFGGALDLPAEKFAPAANLWLIKLPPRTQEVMRLNELQPLEKQAIVDEFAQSKFQPIVLSGPLSNYTLNKMEVVDAFRKLDDRIDALIKAKQAGTPPPAQQQPAPAQPAPKDPPPAEPEKKKGLVDSLKDLLDKKKKE